MTLDEIKFMEEINDYYYHVNNAYNATATSNNIIVIAYETEHSNPWENGNGNGPPFVPPPFQIVPEFDCLGLIFGLLCWGFLLVRRRKNS
jgi:hypothetical protein